MARKIYDVTLTIAPGMLIWPGDPEVVIDAAKSIARGDSNNVSMLHLGSHTGTHVDAPRHFLPSAPGVDAISPEILVSPARLFQLPEARQIDRKLLEKLDLKGVTRILFGTRNSALLQRQALPRGAFAVIVQSVSLYYLFPKLGDLSNRNGLSTTFQRKIHASQRLLY